MKSVGYRPCDDAPCGRMAAFGRGRPFWEAGCNCARPYMLCQFNAIQHVLAHGMNNIIL